MRIDYRWGVNDVDRDRRYAAELVALAPDVILDSGTLSVAVLQQVTRTVPIVFGGVTDPVGAGLVETLARPGGNITGFTVFEYGIESKMAGIAHADRAERDTGRSPSRSDSRCWNRAVRRHPRGRTVAGSRVASDRRARRRRDRTRGRCLRADLEWWVDCDRECGGVSHRDFIITLAAEYSLPAVYGTVTWSAAAD